MAHLECYYSKRLLSKLRTLDPNSKYLDFFKIETAIAWAKKYHDGQFRKSGEPFYSHPLEVAYLISDYSLKTNVIVTSILHDIVEDTDVTIGMLVDEFGFRIAQMVDMLTRDRPDGTKLSVEEILNNALRKHDREVLIIKLFDRWHNMQTIEFMTPEKQNKQRKKTLKNFLFLLEDMSLFDIADSIYKICIPSTTYQRISTDTILRGNVNLLDDFDPILPFPYSQNI